VASFCPIESRTGNTYAGHLVPQATGRWERTRNRCKTLSDCRAIGEERNASSSCARGGKARGRIDRIPKRSGWLHSIVRPHGVTAACHRLFGFSAKKTADLARRCMNGTSWSATHATDSRYLSQDVVVTLPGIEAQAIEGPRYPRALGSAYRGAPAAGDDSLMIQRSPIITQSFLTATSPDKVALSH